MIIDLSELRWSIDANKALNLGPIPRMCVGSFVPRSTDTAPASFDEGLDGWLEHDPDNEGLDARHLERIAHLTAKE